MSKRLARICVVALSTAALIGPPGATSAQILDPCSATATLSPPPPFGHQVAGSATYSCTNEHFFISVVGCLLLDGVPIHCDEDTATNSSSASVDLSFPCLPGVWTAVAVGAGADRALPAPDASRPAVVLQCDPLDPPAA